MSKSYPIWTSIDSTYKTDKSFGNYYSSSTFVGSSNTYSQKFFEQEVCFAQQGNIRIFRLEIDGELIKVQYFNTKTKEFYDDKSDIPLTEESFWKLNKD